MATDWEPKEEVFNNETRLGYWDWVEAQYELLHEAVEA